MRFCTHCGSNMSKSVVTGQVQFSCRCQIQEKKGTAEDTLMYEEMLETAESNLKHEVFIENSPFDAAANIVMKDCPKCNLNFITLIRVGINEAVMYTCTCGFRATVDEYNKTIAKKQKETP